MAYRRRILWFLFCGAALVLVVGLAYSVGNEAPSDLSERGRRPPRSSPTVSNSDAATRIARFKTQQTHSVRLSEAELRWFLKSLRGADGKPNDELNGALLRYAAFDASTLGRACLVDLPTAVDPFVVGGIYGRCVSRAEAALRENLIQEAHRSDDVRLRDYLFEGIAVGLAGIDPKMAYDLSLNILDRERADLASGKILNEWMRKHPKDGPMIAAQFDHTDLGSKQLRHFYPGWMTVDFEGATDWLAKQPLGSATDPYISDVAYKLMSQSDYTTAARWLATMQPGEHRSDALTHLAKRIGNIPEYSTLLGSYGFKRGADFE
jgi:hypothetical protein